MDFNTCISEYMKGNVVIEDVIVCSTFDGTSAEVVLCGPFGLELSACTLADAELRSLKSDLSTCNFIYEA